MVGKLSLRGQFPRGRVEKSRQGDNNGESSSSRHFFAHLFYFYIKLSSVCNHRMTTEAAARGAAQVR